MDLIKKLDECEARLKEVQELIMDPDLVKDQKKYKDTMRENGYLTEVCELYAEYKKILQGIKDSTEMITMEDDVEKFRNFEEYQYVSSEDLKADHKLISKARKNKRSTFIKFNKRRL